MTKGKARKARSPALVVRHSSLVSPMCRVLLPSWEINDLDVLLAAKVRHRFRAAAGYLAVSVGP